MARKVHVQFHTLEPLGIYFVGIWFNLIALLDVVEKRKCTSRAVF
jgi:hypothetical protein